jgi:YbbR domain-containing protein
VTLEEVDPSEIRVTLEPREEKYVPVSPVVAGEPAPGFEVVGRSTSPQAALISGPRSAVAAMQRIETATVDVSGRRESFTQRVPLAPRNRLIEVRDQSQRTVDLRIEIVEQPVTEQFDGVQVEVINNRYQVQVNPSALGVALSGPPSVLAQIDPEQMRLVIDAAELEPQEDDYRIEPAVRFEQTELGERVEVVAMYPQRVIDVHIFREPVR